MWMTSPYLLFKDGVFSFCYFAIDCSHYIYGVSSNYLTVIIIKLLVTAIAGNNFFFLKSELLADSNFFFHLMLLLAFKLLKTLFTIFSTQTIEVE